MEKFREENFYALIHGHEHQSDSWYSDPIDCMLATSGVLNIPSKASGELLHRVTENWTTVMPKLLRKYEPQNYHHPCLKYNRGKGFRFNQGCFGVCDYHGKNIVAYSGYDARLLSKNLP